jgi:putative ABC transport system permease protein
MFRYYLKLGVLSIRSNPALSGLMVAAIATGIGACVTIMNIEYVMGSNPIPHRADILYHVQLDNWDPYNAAVEPDLPPTQVTLRDGRAIMAAEKARRQVISYKTLRVIEPADPDQLPFQVESRSTTADFFPMFDTPFLYGSGWDADADANEEFVVVINREINETLFGGENSVGRNVVMNGETWRVTGVLDTWEPMPKYYDLNNSQFSAAEEVFFPFKAPAGTEREDFYNSECVWLQFWVELHGDEEKQAYLAFLDAYVEQQKALGRFDRPLNNRLNNVMEWLQVQGVVPDDVRVLFGLAVLFLVVCLLNTIGLILAKVMRRAGDISLRRALGASRRAIFTQYVVEAGVVGVVGGLFGIATAWMGLRGIRGLYGQNSMVEHITGLDWSMTLAAVGLAVASALLAAIYPTWRACSIQPAAQLKAQ